MHPQPEVGWAVAGAWQHGSAPPFVSTDLAAALARPDEHAVYIATPHPFHADPVPASLAAGKPVLREKPMTINATGTRALVELAQRQRVFLMEAVWTRVLPIYASVQQWLQGGEIGAVRAMQSSFCLNRPFKPGDRRYAGLRRRPLVAVPLRLLRRRRQQFSHPGRGRPHHRPRWLLGSHGCHIAA